MQILTTLTDSMTAQLNSIHLGILKLISLTFMLETTYIQKKIEATYLHILRCQKSILLIS